MTARNQKEKLVFLHCIVNQEALCKSVLKISNVTDVVIKIINFLWAKALNHKQFVGLLEDHETERGGICCRTNVRWLSLGEVVKRLWDLRVEIREVCEMKGKNVSELSDAQWIADFAFALDVTAQMKKLTTNVQG